MEDETSFGKAVVSRFVETIQHNVIVGSSKVVVRKTMVKIVDVPLDTILRMEIKNTISLWIYPHPEASVCISKATVVYAPIEG